MSTLEDRLWSKTEKTPTCWNFTAALNMAGYGVIMVSSTPLRIELAHRVSWKLVNGPIPDGLELCHTCDNPRCIRPDHLFLGTHQENMADSGKKGRMAFKPNRKLSWDKVQEIRLRSKDGEKRKVLAAEFGVDPALISDIVLGKRWKENPSPI